MEKIYKTICFTGHRPDKLYGWDMKDRRYQTLEYKILKILYKNILENKISTVITGGALGLDTIAFSCVNTLKKKTNLNIKNILAIPFINQSKAWLRETDILRYEKMKSIADELIYVDTIDKYKVPKTKEGEYHPVKMQKRNAYIVDNSDIVIAIWDGIKKGGTWNCVKYAQKLGKEIIYINPKEI